MLRHDSLISIVSSSSSSHNTVCLIAGGLERFWTSENIDNKQQMVKQQWKVKLHINKLSNCVPF